MKVKNVLYSNKQRVSPGFSKYPVNKVDKGEEEDPENVQLFIQVVGGNTFEKGQRESPVKHEEAV